MDKVHLAISLLEQKKNSEFCEIIEEIIKEKLIEKLEKKKKKYFCDSYSIEEDKRPARVKNADAVKILRSAGYIKARSGKHQSIWKHETDPTKNHFSLPHHSRELSPGLTDQLYAL